MEPITEALLNSFYSLGRVLLGFGMACFFGVTLGLMRTQLPVSLKRNFLFNFFLDVGKYPPPIAWVPFIILLFGNGNFAGSLIVFIGAFYPIQTGTFEGVEKIPTLLNNTVKTFEVPFWKKMKILFMTALPQIYAGLKIGLGMGWMCVVAAEMISARNGLGFALQIHRQSERYDLLTLDIVCIGGLGCLLNYTLTRLEKYIMPWHESF